MPPSPGIEEIRAEQIRIPVVAAGTEPGHPDEQRSHPRRPLWLDRRLLPPVQEIREPFAFRVGRESGRRVRGLMSRGDYAVISRERSLGPGQISPREVYAVRLGGMVVLSRADYKEGKLLLLPAGEEGVRIEMLDAAKPAALAQLIGGGSLRCCARSGARPARSHSSGADVIAEPRAPLDRPVRPHRSSSPEPELQPRSRARPAPSNRDSRGAVQGSSRLVEWS